MMEDEEEEEAEVKVEQDAEVEKEVLSFSSFHKQILGSIFLKQIYEHKHKEAKQHRSQH